MFLEKFPYKVSSKAGSKKGRVDGYPPKLTYGGPKIHLPQVSLSPGQEGPALNFSFLPSENSILGVTYTWGNERFTYPSDSLSQARDEQTIPWVRGMAG